MTTLIPSHFSVLEHKEQVSPTKYRRLLCAALTRQPPPSAAADITAFFGSTTAAYDW